MIHEIIGIWGTGEGPYVGLSSSVGLDAPSTVTPMPGEGGGKDIDYLSMANEVMAYLSQWGTWLTNAISTYQSNMAHAEEEGTRFLPALIAAPPVLSAALVATACAAVPAVGGALVLTNIASGVMKATLDQRQIDLFNVFISLFRRSMFATVDSTRSGLAEILAKVQAHLITTQDGQPVSAAALLKLLDGDLKTLASRFVITKDDQPVSAAALLDLLLDAVKDLAYNTETIDLGGIHASLRNRIIHD